MRTEADNCLFWDRVGDCVEEEKEDSLVQGEQQPAQDLEIQLIPSITVQRAGCDIDTRPDELLNKTRVLKAGGGIRLVVTDESPELEHQEGDRLGVDRGKLSVLVEELYRYRANIRKRKVQRRLLGNGRGGHGKTMGLSLEKLTPPGPPRPRGHGYKT